MIRRFGADLRQAREPHIGGTPPFSPLLGSPSSTALHMQGEWGHWLGTQAQLCWLRPGKPVRILHKQSSSRLAAWAEPGVRRCGEPRHGDVLEGTRHASGNSSRRDYWSEQCEWHERFYNIPKYCLISWRPHANSSPTFVLTHFDWLAPRHPHLPLDASHPAKARHDDILNGRYGLDELGLRLS